MMSDGEEVADDKDDDDDDVDEEEEDGGCIHVAPEPPILLDCPP